MADFDTPVDDYLNFILKRKSSLYSITLVNFKNNYCKI